MYRQLLLILTLIFCTHLSFAQVEDGEIIDDEAIDNTVIKNDKRQTSKKPKKESKFKVDNIFLGTTFSLFLGNPLYVDISPYGGYLIGKYLGVGIGATYIYSAYSPAPNVVINDHVYGGRLFANVRPFPEVGGLKGLYAHFEGEYLNHQDGFTTGGNPVRKFVPAMHLGLGYNTAFDKGFAFTTEVLINPLWFSQVRQGIRPVYGTFWQYRLGLYYAF